MSFLQAQYEFVYETMLEVTTTGTTNIPCSLLEEELINLQEVTNDSGSILEEQFKVTNISEILAIK